MPTVALLIASNLFMTAAWYWHLRFPDTALWKVILISWGLAFVEYCLAVPANRIGFRSGLSGAQLKIIQEVVTLAVFALFAVVWLKEPVGWRYLGAAGFLFAGKGG